MKIGDLFLGLAIDPSGDLKAAVTKSAKEAGDAGGKQLGLSLSAGLKAASAAVAVGFGLMLKGSQEMERAQGDFQAATGRSREEAVAFSRDMNSLVGTAATVGMSFQDITKAGIAVSQQFGITGEKATALTADILAFSKVTGQDAEQAAFQLEDTLSAFGLTADDAAAAMDLLVASNQKFGTSAGPESLSILQDMAPALTAMGMGLDDGVELLNAFEVAGIDAGAAQVALKKAIGELKPGENIDDLITKIGAIEDPLLRAQAAAEVFGSKAGAKMAALIKPGMTSMDEFGLTAEETAGTVDQAADDMLTTGDKIRQFGEKAGAALRGLGQDIGPVLSGLGGLATVGAALPNTLTQPLIDGLKGVWTKVAASPVVKAAATLAGTAASAAYNVGVVAFDWVAGGTIAGKVFGGAFVIGALLAVPLLAKSIMDEFHKHFSGLLTGGGTDPFNTALAGGPSAGSRNWGAQQGTAAGSAAVDAIIAQFELGKIAARGPQLIFGPPVPASTVSQHLIPPGTSDQVAADLRETMVLAGRTAMVDSANALRQFGVETTDALGAGMTSAEATHGLMNDISTLKDALEKYLSPRQQAIELIGSDYIKTLRKGMQSEDENLKTASQNLAIGAIATIEDAGLKGKKGQKGLRDIGILYDQLLASGMEKEAIAAKLRAADVSETVISGLSGEKQKDAAETSGQKIAQAFIAGIAAFLRSEVAERRVHDAAGAATKGLQGHSPPKVGPLRFIDKWGENVGAAWLGGVQRGVAGLALTLGAGPAFGLSPLSASSTATMRHEIDITPEAARSLRGAGFDDERIVRLFNELVLAPNVEQRQVRWSAGGS